MYKWIFWESCVIRLERELTGTNVSLRLCLAREKNLEQTSCFLKEFVIFSTRIIVWGKKNKEQSPNLSSHYATMLLRVKWKVLKITCIAVEPENNKQKKINVVYEVNVLRAVNFFIFFILTSFIYVHQSFDFIYLMCYKM